jgi:hypothetical protein
MPTIQGAVLLVIAVLGTICAVSPSAGAPERERGEHVWIAGPRTGAAFREGEHVQLLICALALRDKVTPHLFTLEPCPILCAALLC